MNVIDLTFNFENMFAISWLAIEDISKNLFPNFIKVLLLIILCPGFKYFGHLEILEKANIAQNIELSTLTHPIAQTNKLSWFDFQKVGFFVD